MFRPTDRQLPLLDAKAGVARGAQGRLKGSWAEGFRQKVMPELLASESPFSALYGKEGRPNWSVARMLGISILQQLQDMSDQEALDALSFDIRWQHALDLASEEAYLSRRSLVEFRRRLVEVDGDGELLRGVFDRICLAGIRGLGLQTAEQRMDSTKIMSNIRTLGRVSLAKETIRVFLRSLGPKLEQVSKEIQLWYGEGKEGWEGDEEIRGRVDRKRVGQWATDLLSQFEKDEEVAKTEAYGHLVRLGREHGDALGIRKKGGFGEGGDDGNESGHGSGEVPDAGSSAKSVVSASETKSEASKAEPPKESARYWSPHDPDASFGHKGLGYHVHIAETCRNETTELLTDYEVLTAAQSDIGQSKPSLKRLANRGIQPSTYYTDGGYPRPIDLIESQAMGCDLFAPVHRGRLPKNSFSRMDFEWDEQMEKVVRCPNGHASSRHAERQSSDSGKPRRGLHVFFDKKTCDGCEKRKLCPVRSPNHGGASEYRLELSAELIARDKRWVEQQTKLWQERYRIRSGIEATNSEMKRGHGLDRLRVRGMKRVRMQVAFKVTACNVKRWLRAASVLVLTLRTIFRLRFPSDRPGIPLFA